MISLEKMALPLEGENPAGKNLEYDPLYLEMDSLSVAVPDSQMGESKIEGRLPDWKKLKTNCLALWEKTRHFSISGAEYLSRDVSSLGIKNPMAESALRLQFSAGPPFSAETLVFLALGEADASLLLRLLDQETVGVYINNNGEYIALEGVDFAIPLLSGEELFDNGAKPGILLRTV